MSSPFFPLSLPARKTTHPAFSLPNRPHVLTHYYRKFFDHYLQGRYAEALATAQKINLPEYFPTHYAAAIAHARLGNQKAAEAAAKEVLRL